MIIFYTALNFHYLFRNTSVIWLKTNFSPSKIGVCVLRFYSDKISSDGTYLSERKVGGPHRELDGKYVTFQECDAPVLLDIYEEKMQLEKDTLQKSRREKEEFYGLNLQRGVQGVFDIEDLIELLKRDKAEDIFTAVLPPEAKYVDYIVIVTGRSRRHMTSIAEIVRRVFKKKRLSTDILPRIEGENSTIWIAMDLGNIALHIFSHDARKAYDLESLWSVGPEFDPLINVPDKPLIALLKKHAISLNDITSKGKLL